MLKRLFLALLLMGTMLHAAEAPTKNSVTEIYIATFDRAPDAAGLDYWVNSGLSIEEIAASFFDQAETKKLYPDTMSNSKFIDQIYQNVFRRAPDAAGKAYWLLELNNGSSRSNLLLAVINGAQGDDKLLLEHKTTVGLAFANDGRDDLVEANIILDNVTADPKSVPLTLCEYNLEGCPFVLLVSPADAYTLVDGNITYTATAAFMDGETEDVTASAEWITSDSEIASIDQNGEATGISVDTVIITAVYSSNGTDVQSGSVQLTVKAEDPVFESLKIEGSDIVAAGLTAQLTAIATLSDGSTVSVNDKVDWESDSAGATVDAAGVVTGVSEDDVVITATAKEDNTIIATHNMAVTEAELLSIQIEDGYNVDTPQPITSDLNVSITTEHTITAWGIYSNGDRVDINADTIWWSDDQQVVSMNASNVYGRDLGTTTVTAHYEGLEASITVNVVLPDGAPTLTSITLETDDGTDVTDGSVDPIPAGFKTWVTAYGTYSDGTTENINRYVAYSSNHPEIAYINDKIDSNIHGLSDGDANITA